MQDFVLAVGQWPVVDDLRTNLDAAERFLRAAKDQHAQLALLPEMFQTPYDIALMRSRAEDHEGPSLTRIKTLARNLGLYVIGGSICEAKGDRLYNSSYVIGPDGTILGVHRKIHLFDIDLPNLRVTESAVLSAGERPLVLNLPFARVGVAICYDVRFNDVFSFFEGEDVEVVALPAAFSQTTGQAHWHLLMRARAVDYQTYVAAACPAPNAGGPYTAYGHSLVVDPWGVVLAEAGEAEQCLVVRISAARFQEVRRQMPVLAHRRPTLYRLWHGQADR